MNYEIVATPRFKRGIKKLSKKYPLLKAEYKVLLYDLNKNPAQGIPLCNECYKIRISIASNGKGQSGGGRVITHFVIKDDVVFLLTMYDKSAKETITDNELNDLLSQISG